MEHVGRNHAGAPNKGKQRKYIMFKLHVVLKNNTSDTFNKCVRVDHTEDYLVVLFKREHNNPENKTSIRFYNKNEILFYDRENK